MQQCCHWGVDVAPLPGCLVAVLSVGKLFSMLPVIANDDGGGPGADGDWTIGFCHGDWAIGVSSDGSNV